MTPPWRGGRRWRALRRWRGRGASAEGLQGSRRARARLCQALLSGAKIFEPFLTLRGSGAFSARARGSAGLPARRAEERAEWAAAGAPRAGSRGSGG